MGLGEKVVLNVANDVRDRTAFSGKRRIRVSYHVLEPFLAFSDACIIVLCSILGGIGYQLSIGQQVGDVGMYAGIGLVCAVAYAVSARHLELHSLPRFLEGQRDYLDVLSAWGFVILFLSVIFFLLKLGNDVSRGSISAFCVSGAFALVISRKVTKVGINIALAHNLVHGRQTVVIGTAGELVSLRREFLLQHYGIEEIDRIVLRSNQLSSLAQSLTGNDVLDRIHQLPADQIILALPWQDGSDFEAVRNWLRISPLPVRLLPDSSARAILEIGDSPSALLIDLQRAPMTRFEQAVKRALDLVVAGTCVVILSLLMLIAAALIKLESPGPVIFRQRRNGFNGRPFGIYKFRTMNVTEDGSEVIQARKNDPRVTRVGRILRLTSIDELPQLFNVLKGDMSIVGPRPHAIAHDYEYGGLIADYAFRRHVKPGMTGWAQVHGYRGGTQRVEQMSKRVELDLWYINNWSLGLDLQILARTVIEIARSRNAY